MSWYNIKAQSDGSKSAEVTIKGTIGTDVSCDTFLAEFAAITADEITLHINSDGGSVVDGFAIYDAIVAHPARVVASIYRLAASMATIVALACDEVVVSPSAFVMIHSPLMLSASGHSSELRDLAAVLDKFAGRMAEIYCERLKKSAEDVSAIMAKDTWWTAREAVENGFADRISTSVAPVSCADFRMLAVASAPAAVKEFFNQPSAQTPKETQPDKQKGKPMNEKLKKALVVMGIQAELTEDTIDSLLTKVSELQTALEAAKKQLTDKEEEEAEEQARVDAVLALGDKYSLGAEAVAAVKAKTSLADFTASALEAVSKRATEAAAQAAAKPQTPAFGKPVGVVAAAGGSETLESLRASLKDVTDPIEKGRLVAKIRVLRDGEAK